VTDEILPGDRVEYIAEPVFDLIIDTGEIGWVTRVEGGWVIAAWPRSGVHSVPIAHVRLLPPEVTRVVAQQQNELVWDLLGEELPPIAGRRQRDPYLYQGSHPDVVERVWDELGKALPRDCRALAKGGKPVLAHPDTDRIFALPHGTAYALWLIPEDFERAVAEGVQTKHEWSNGSVTDLAQRAGAGWVWGSWHDAEPLWARRAYDAGGPP
jgi:hypothetical protein